MPGIHYRTSCLIVALNFLSLPADGAPGDVDPGFNPGANNNVRSLAIQPDGKIIAAGEFTVLSGGAHVRIVRLGADGVPDASFNPTADGTVQCTMVHDDGSILTGGDFT